MKLNLILLVSSIILTGLFCCCSQEDDYYKSDMYTMAEMGTRMGGKGDPGGDNPTPPVNNVILSDTTYHSYMITLSHQEGISSYSYDAEVYVMMYRKDSIPAVLLTGYSCAVPLCTVDEAWMQPRVNASGYTLSFKGMDRFGIVNTGVLENYVFF